MDRYSEQDVVRKIVAMSVNLEKTFPKASEEMVKCAEKFINKDISFVDSYDTALSFVSDKQILASMIQDRDMMREAGWFQNVRDWLPGSEKRQQDKMRTQGDPAEMKAYDAKQKEEANKKRQEAGFAGHLSKMHKDVEALLEKFKGDINSEMLMRGLTKIKNDWEPALANMPEPLRTDFNKYLGSITTFETAAQAKVNGIIGDLKTFVDEQKKTFDALSGKVQADAAAAPAPAAGTPTTPPTGAKAGTGVGKNVANVPGLADAQKMATDKPNATVYDFRSSPAYSKLSPEIKALFDNAKNQERLQDIVNQIAKKQAPAPATSTSYEGQGNNEAIAFSKKDLVVLSQVLDDSGFHREAESVLNFIK